MGYHALLLAAMLGAAAFAQPVPYATCAEVQRAIGSLPAALVIDRPNVTLTGAGPTTVFRLAHRINQPGIVIGSAAPRPSTVLRGVIVRDLAIDANGEKQTQECDEPGCPFGSLRANGLTIRSAADFRIENVSISNARSGGLVTELGCRRLQVSGLKSEANILVGIAFYETEDSSFGPMQLLSNGASGISRPISASARTASTMSSYAPAATCSPTCTWSSAGSTASFSPRSTPIPALRPPTTSSTA